MRRLAALGIVFWLSSAYADDADAMIERGIQLREQGKDAAALTLFEQAFRTTPSPRAKAQVALAEQALGRWRAAEMDLTAALASTSDAWIAKYKEVLDAALSTVRSHLGDLQINGGVAGAKVRIDGVEIATLPHAERLRIDAGSHTLEIVAEGYYPISQPVSIRPDIPAAVTVEMRPRAATPPAEGHPPIVAPSDDRRAPPPDRGHVQRVVGITITVSAVAPLALGLIGLGARASEISAYNADATCPGVTFPNKPPACQAHIDAADTWQTVSVVGFVTAGVLALGGAVVAFTAPRSANLAISISPAWTGLSVRW